MTVQIDRILEAANEMKIKDLTELLARLMEEFNSDNEHTRFAMLFNVLQSQYPETLDEFTRGFAARAAEAEEQAADTEGQA